LRVAAPPAPAAWPLASVNARAAGVVVAQFPDLALDAARVYAIIQTFNAALTHERRLLTSERRLRIIDDARKAAERQGKPAEDRLAREKFDEVEAYNGGKRSIGYRKLEPIEHYAKEKWITPRQCEAAMQLREDWDLGIWGAHDPDAPASSGAKTSGLSEAQMMAAYSYAAAVDRLGKAFRPLVERVVCAGEWIDEIAERRVTEEDPAKARRLQRIERDRLYWQLRAGLDILGDAYDYPAEVIRETFALDGREIVVEYRHEADSTISAVLHSGLPWLYSAKSLGELKQAAARFIRKRQALVELVTA